jgi:hypothetical protein
MNHDKAASAGARLAVPFLLVLATTAPGRAASPTITDLRVVSLKAGTRAAVVWRTDAPTTSHVRFGIGQTLVPASPRARPEAPTRDHVALLEPLTPGRIYRVLVVAAGALGASTSETSFEARAPAFDEAAAAYAINLLVRFDWDLTRSEMQDWSAAFEAAATRVNDMTDGWVSLGTVVLADATGADPSGFTYCSPAECGAGADVAVFSGVGLDLYPGPARVPLMWPQSVIGGIERAGASIEVPRWLDWPVPEDETVRRPYIGAMLTHELGHYALWLDDQYGSTADECVSSAFDLSIMSNLSATEIDSKDTPCAWQQTHGGNSWDLLLRAHYPEIPTRIGPPAIGPEVPGECFGIVAVNRGFS